MNALTKITSVVAVSTMVLLGAGCDRKEGTTAGENTNNTVATPNQDTNNTAPMDNAANNTANTMDNAADSAANTANNAGQSIEDAAITTAVKGKYVLDSDLKAHDINVDTINGVVTLTGAAPSPAAVEKATTVARSVDGVRDVQNQLTVKAIN